MYLTNKNLILVYENSTGFFKTEEVVEKISLDDIRIIKGKVQIFEVDDEDYGLGMQIIFKNGSRDHFVFEKKKEISSWIDAITEMLKEAGNDINVKDSDSSYEKKEDLDEEEKYENDHKSKVHKEISTALFSDLIASVDSAKDMVKSIKNQIKEKKFEESNTKNKANLNNKNSTKDLDDKISCPNCGEKIDSKSKFCNSCGVLIKSNEKDKEIEEINKKEQDKKTEEIKKQEQEEKKHEESSERKMVYDGKIHKCPNCGEVLESFVTNCPACGFELSRKEINESLKDFIDKINKCEVEIANNKSGWESWSTAKKVGWVILNLCFFGIPLVIYFVLPLALINKTPKLSKEEQEMANLIENFPFPNDRESILAALVFAKEKASFLSNENVDRKSAYWLQLWNTRAVQLKQKADMLFPNDKIVEKSYEDIINAGNKVKKIIRRKAIVGFVILIIAIIILALRYWGNLEFMDEVDYNATFEWQTNGLFEKLPEPETNNGRILSETDNQIQIELYYISLDEFNEYTKRCRENGFTSDITKSENVFYSKDDKGYNLNIFYDNKKQIMKISLDSYNVSNKDDSEKNSQTENSNPVSLGDNIVVNSNKYIKIKNFEYTIFGKFITGIITIKNSDSKNAIQFPSFRVTAYTKDGKVLGSEDRILNILYPNQEMTDVGTLIEVSEKPYKVEVTMLEPKDYNVLSTSSLEHPVYKEMKCQNLSVNSDKITGEVYNPNDYKIESAMIVIVFRDSNKNVVSSESTFINDIPIKGKTPFDLSLASDAKITDNVEAFAYLW